MDSEHIDEELSRRCLRALRNICGRTGFLPTSYTIPEGHVTKSEELAFASGGFADVRNSHKLPGLFKEIYIALGLGRHVW